jgi:hypothetical protein
MGFTASTHLRDCLLQMNTSDKAEVSSKRVSEKMRGAG